MKRLILALSLVGCGNADGLFGAKEKGASDAEAPRSLYVTTAAEIPTCDGASEGWLVYVKAEESFKACVGGQWTTVAAAQTRATTRIDCTGVIADYAYTVKYSVTMLSSGDVFATGSLVEDGAYELSRSEYFSKTHPNHDKAPIILVNDVTGTGNGGFWTIALKRGTGEFIAAYIDAEVGEQAQVFAFAADSCSTVAY